MAKQKVTVLNQKIKKSILICLIQQEIPSKKIGRFSAVAAVPPPFHHSSTLFIAMNLIIPKMRTLEPTYEGCCTKIPKTTTAAPTLVYLGDKDEVSKSQHSRRAEIMELAVAV